VAHHHDVGQPLEQETLEHAEHQWEQSHDHNRVVAEVYGAGKNTQHEDRKHAVMAEKVGNACHGRKTWRGRGIVCLNFFFDDFGAAYTAQEMQRTSPYFFPFF
jgi:hypothetical protein